MGRSEKANSFENKGMSYKIVIEPRAIADIQEAVEYYESRREDLGAYFFQIVDEYIEIIHLSDGATPPPPEPMP